jgi:primosomal protein N'
METCYHCHQAHPRTQACDKCHPINLVYAPKEKTP